MSIVTRSVMLPLSVTSIAQLTDVGRVTSSTSYVSVKLRAPVFVSMVKYPVDIPQSNV
mgnify:CR=1 FL=1